MAGTAEPQGAAGGIFLLAALAGAAAATGAALLWPAKRAAPRPDFEPPELVPAESWATSSDGTRLRVLTYGPSAGPPLVLAHGWACASEVWLPQVRTLAGAFRVTVFDQRGHGQSEAGPGRFSTDVLADDLDAVLAHVLGEGERAVLVGHSMGGMSILSWAGRYPGRARSRVAAAVLVATSAYCPPRRCNNLVAAAFGLPVPSGAAGWIRRSWLTRAVTRSAALSPAAQDAAVDFTARMALACPPRARGEWQRTLVPLDIRSGIGRLAAPTTVVVGEADRLLPLGHSRKIAESLARSGWLERFVVLPGCGHMVGLEASGSLNAIIRGAAQTARRRGLPAAE